MDAEGRYIEAQFDNLSVISLYLPSGSSGEERQAIKFNVLDYLLPYLQEIGRNGRDYIICGDWNIAHKEIDLKNWRGNRKNSGFLPEERAWLDRLFDDKLWFDAFRLINQEAEQYTWWSNRGQAWSKNVGWRIDYQVINKTLRDKIRSTSIYKNERFSDHAPLIIDYDYPF
nr:exodeoxyribonuclease III [Methylomarinum sp. Ch1-1]MDP4522139.1 exodeoxyribonuclease III [Methylomarinum sp. Ch1-1]